MNKNSNRIELLDGLRGIAAIFVLFRHTQTFWNFSFYHSYLAVDLFFILSGYVIAQNYNKKLISTEISRGFFISARLIRLYPVYLFSIALSILALIYKTQSNQDPNEIKNIAWIVLFSLAFIPFPTQSKDDLFVLNGPHWSLLFEIIANAIYVFLVKKLNKFFLASTISACGLGLVYICFKNNNLDIGYTWSPLSFAGGFCRSTFGFFMGIFMFSNKENISSKIPSLLKRSPLLPVFIVTAILSMPKFNRFNLNQLIDLFSVFIIFPFCITLASTAPHTITTKALSITGTASYPLYVLHVPVSIIVGVFIEKNIIPINKPLLGILFLTTIVAICYIIEKHIDVPIRKKLTSLRNQLIK